MAAPMTRDLRRKVGARPVRDRRPSICSRRSLSEAAPGTLVRCVSKMGSPFICPVRQSVDWAAAVRSELVGQEVGYR
jgi:hypothetical protein